MSGFIQQSLVFIGASIVLVPLFKRLGFGTVLGYLIAGILVGPFGLKLIDDPLSVSHFAELGVVLLLFVIGLEIQPRKLWDMRKQLLGLGGMQVLLSTLVLMILFLTLGLNAINAFVVSFALSLSSTAFAMQTLMERNQSGTHFGRAVFSVLLMQDLLAIPALAIIPALGVASSRSSSQLPLGTLALFIPLFVVALSVISRFLLRPIFRWMAAMRSREIFTATALFIVLGVTAIMEQVGLSAALGTFIAGVLLADSEYRHELEADIEPFKSLLMGLFFISVGIGVNLQVFLAQPFLLLGLALLYLLGKALVMYAVGRIFSSSHENAKMAALHLAQGGEFAFVIFGIALAFQLADPKLLSFLTVVISLSMLLNPFLHFLNERIRSFRNRNAPAPAYDAIADEAPQVIIAGFGRVGQVFARILRSQGIAFVAIDQDSDQIELVRRFEHKVYYGDVARVDLLESAGAARAKYFILAIDDVEASLKTAKIVKENFPNLKIMARARNRGHVYDLMDLKVHAIKRETFDSSLAFAGDLLMEMGYSAPRTETLLKKFKAHDELMLGEQYKVRFDDKELLSLSRQGTAQLEQVLNDESVRTYVGTPVTGSPEHP